jgi:hypothetical protein
MALALRNMWKPFLKESCDKVECDSKIELNRPPLTRRYRLKTSHNIQNRNETKVLVLTNSVVKILKVEAVFQAARPKSYSQSPRLFDESLAVAKHNVRTRW